MVQGQMQISKPVTASARQVYTERRFLQEASLRPYKALPVGHLGKLEMWKSLLCLGCIPQCLAKSVSTVKR